MSGYRRARRVGAQTKRRRETEEWLGEWRPVMLLLYDGDREDCPICRLAGLSIHHDEGDESEDAAS